MAVIFAIKINKIIVNNPNEQLYRHESIEMQGLNVNVSCSFWLHSYDHLRSCLKFLKMW